MTSSSTIRLAEAVAAVRRLDGIDVAFSARLDRRRTTFLLEDMQGTRTTALHDLVSPSGRGVGGRCMALRRPVAVVDYVRADTITHEFDDAVTQEGLRAVLALPVTVDGEVRGAVYAASRRPVRWGERFTDVAVSIVRTAERDLRREQVVEDRRGTGEARLLHAELRAIAATVAEPAARERLLRLCRRLAEDRPAAGPAVPLTPREIDVLAQVAVGCGNAEAAARLSLQVATVKSYLKSAMAKLDSHNRCEAVFAAQRAGLIP
jgi:LuxR family transcriptional regulator, regulator of acetate metabolism